METISLASVLATYTLPSCTAIPVWTTLPVAMVSLSVPSGREEKIVPEAVSAT
ncbi:hypothetical protein [Tomitella cavernea]|uniref:hypothetical protein n=1 Tax=Tomitella cavernea TaxID=1387982 RepID=UPI0031E941A0